VCFLSPVVVCDLIIMMQQNCELLVGHGLQYIRIIWIGLSTRLVNHYTVYITEPITVRKEMIGKRDTY